MIGLNGAHHHFHVTRSELGRVNWAHSIRNIGVSMVAVLVPIYLLQLGYSLEQAIYYQTLAGVFWLVLIYPTMRLVGAIGGNRVMALAMIVSMAQLLALTTMPTLHWPLELVAFLWGLMVALYWYSLRANYASGIDLSKTGSQVGISNALYLTGGGLAPAIGGIIGSKWGIHFTYITALVLVVIALLPLLRANDSAAYPKPNLSRVKFKAFFRDYFSNFCLTADDMIQVTAWPLLIFFTIPSYAGVGIASTIMVISGIIISLYVGKRESLRGERRYINEGTYSLVAVASLRLIAQNTATISGVNFLYGASRALVDTPYNSRYYERIRQESSLEYIFGMQIASAFGFIAVGLALLLFLQFLPPVAALTAGLALLIPLSFGIKLLH